MFYYGIENKTPGKQYQNLKLCLSPVYSRKVLKFEVGLSLTPFSVKRKSLFVFRILDALEIVLADAFSANQKLGYIAVMLELNFHSTY